MTLRKKRMALLVVVFVILFFASEKILRERIRSLSFDTVSGANGDQDNSRLKSIEKSVSKFKNGIFPLPKRIARRIFKPKHSVIPDMFYEQHPNISKHDFRLILNPYNTCLNEGKTDLDRSIFLFILIASASWEFERRKIIRSTWVSVISKSNTILKYLFFVGNDGNIKNNERLRQEFLIFGDVVQIDYKETYRNLTLKTQGQLKWLTYFCPSARFYMHIDDDVVPDVENIMKQHIKLPPSLRKISCAKIFKPRVRREGKWMTSLEEYPGDQYPLSCVGWCFVMPRDVALELYYMSLDTSLLHLEDVAFTGILREKLGDVQVSMMKNGGNLCQHMGWPKDKPTNEKILEAWEAIQLRHQEDPE